MYHLDDFTRGWIIGKLEELGQISDVLRNSTSPTVVFSGFGKHIKQAGNLAGASRRSSLWNDGRGRSAHRSNRKMNKCSTAGKMICQFYTYTGT